MYISIIIKTTSIVKRDTLVGDLESGEQDISLKCVLFFVLFSNNTDSFHSNRKEKK